MPRTTARASKKVVSPLEGFRLTSPGRVVYGDMGLTKLDVARYYAAVAEWMLPHMANRPLSLVRCPEGADKACFYQKHPPEGLPAVVGRVPVEEKSGPETYVFVRDAQGLLSLVQFGVLEMHAWGSRVDRIDRPDRMIFDLDPGPEVPWPETIEAAKMMRGLLEELGLRSFVKTSGGKGLHVVVPLDRKHTWPEVKQFSKAVADFVSANEPTRFLAVMTKALRTKRIFIDYLRNDRGSTSVAAYSTRARKGAPVSVPLDWKELTPKIGPTHFNVQNVPARLQSLRRDPWEEIFEVRQTIRASAKRNVGIR